MQEYFLCPHCEAKVPAGARACPECGSDEETGWSDDPFADEYSSGPAEQRRGSSGLAGWSKLLVAIVAIVTTLSFVLYALPWEAYVVPIVLVLVAVAISVGKGRKQEQVDVEEQLYQALLQRARGDVELARRLVESERRRNPTAPDAELLKDALYRWDRDRR